MVGGLKCSTVKEMLFDLVFGLSDFGKASLCSCSGRTTPPQGGRKNQIKAVSTLKNPVTTITKSQGANFLSFDNPFDVGRRHAKGYVVFRKGFPSKPSDTLGSAN